MPAGDDVLREHERLKTLRAPEEKQWRDIASILMPEDSDFGSPPYSGATKDDAEIFDSTPVYAHDNFKGGVFSQLTNPTNRWFELSVGDDDLKQWGPVKDWLWRVTSKVLLSLQPASASFYGEAPPWFGDLGAFGIGALSQEERVGMGRIADRSVPLRQCYMDVDAEGEVDRFHNEFMWSGRQLKQKFRQGLPAEVKEDRDYTIVHATYANEYSRGDKIGWQHLPYRGCYVSPDLKDMKIEGGFGEIPYHTITWSRRGWRVYPHGPAHKTRGDMLQLQAMERSHIVAAQFTAEPMLLTESEEILAVADIFPNRLVAGGMSEQGKPLVQHLERKQNLVLSSVQSQQRRDAIFNAFYFGILQLMQRPQMTATEFTGFQIELLKLMAPNLANTQIGLSRFIGRRYRMLEAAGQIEPPPDELVGQVLQVDYVSPLAKVQKLEEGRAIVELHKTVEQFALTDPAVRDNFDGDAATRRVADSLYSAAGVIRDQKSVDDIRKRRAAEMQRQAQLEQTGQAVDIAAEAAHAAQAATVARTRTLQ